MKKITRIIWQFSISAGSAVDLELFTSFVIAFIIRMKLNTKRQMRDFIIQSMISRDRNVLS